MPDPNQTPPRRDALDPNEINAQHGQNRTGVEVANDTAFDDYESSLPFDPHAADERVEDEGPEIRNRIHDLGHDVVLPPDES